MMRLTDKEKSLLVFAINVVGDMDVPVAEKENVEFYTVGYAIKCLNKVTDGRYKLKPEAMDGLVALRDRLIHE